MKRYGFLDKEQIYRVLNKVRDAFLAAKGGEEVEEVMSALLTFDERMKVGRRVQIAEMLKSGCSHEEIVQELKVGKSTVALVNRLIEEHPKGYELVLRRGKKVEEEYMNKRYKEVGGSEMIFKRREYSGIRRKDIKR